MKKFTCVADIGNLDAAVAEALEVKRDRFAYTHLGKNKTLLMLFFNSSLRTRLSTQKAAMNLGMNVMVLDVNQGAWKLETERGVIMDGDKPEHLLTRKLSTAIKAIAQPLFSGPNATTGTIMNIIVNDAKTRPNGRNIRALLRSETLPIKNLDKA